jgi:hypothetical protein
VYLIFSVNDDSIYLSEIDNELRKLNAFKKIVNLTVNAIGYLKIKITFTNLFYKIDFY